MKNVNFYLGERRYVKWDIVPTDKQNAVVISGASWRLNLSDGMEESTGSCAISGNRIGALIEPKQQGIYTLSITVMIPPEIFIEEVLVSVLRNKENSR